MRAGRTIDEDVEIRVIYIYTFVNGSPAADNSSSRTRRKGKWNYPRGGYQTLRWVFVNVVWPSIPFSFLSFFFLPNFTGRSFPSCSTLFLLTSLSFHREEYETTERTIPLARTSSRSIVFIPLSSVPRSSGMARREEAFARINRAVPFDTTFHHRTDSNPFNRRPSFRRAYLTKSQPSRRPRSVASGDGWVVVSLNGVASRGTSQPILDNSILSSAVFADNSNAASIETKNSIAKRENRGRCELE